MIIFLRYIFIAIILFSCVKEQGPRYIEIPEEEESNIHWEDEYTDLGTIPTVNPIDTVGLSGSIWILPEYREGSFSIITLDTPDTLVFIDKTKYLYNGQLFTYSLYKSGNTYKLDLYQTQRFGYISGTLSLYFIDLGEFYLTRFIHNDIGWNNTLFITLIKIS